MMPLFIDADIVVAGGIGQTVMQAHAFADRICIDAPSDAVQYGFAITDGAGYGISARMGLTGDWTVAEEFPIYAQMTFKIVNATEAGTWKIRIYLRSG